MSALSALRAAKFLLKFTASRIPDAKNPSVSESSQELPSGIRFDIYQGTDTFSRHKGQSTPTAVGGTVPEKVSVPPRKTFLVVHGLTLWGNQDPRLKYFARSLAALGNRVVAIDLPGLKSCAFTIKDINAIAELVSHLHTQHKKSIRIIGFSYGAGMALAAATQEKVGESVDSILSFGAYYSLNQLWEHYLRICRKEPLTEAEWSDYIFMHCVMAYALRERLGFSSGEEQEIVSLLGNYCYENSLEKKRNVYKKIVEKNADVASLYETTISQKEIAAMSAAGKLKSLRCRVNLLHDQNDRLIPPQHSQLLLDELKSHGRAKLLITPLLSHITAGSFWKIADFWPLCRMVGEIIS